MEKWRQDYYPGKDIIFTEIAYASRDYAADQPWLEDTGASANNNLQRDCYEALFRRYWDRDWIKGTFWHYWKPRDPVAGELFSPQNKPAYDVIDWWYTVRPHHFAIIHDGSGESGT